MVTETRQKAKVFYADIWGLREDKYKYLFENDVQTTKWQELEPVAPYYFLIPKDFALQAEYEKFWKVTEIFKVWSLGVTTHRDHFVVGFIKEEIIQKLRIFTGKLPDELVAQSLNLKGTGTWKLVEARQKAKTQRLEENIHHYSYRPFDNRWVCYDSLLIDRDRRNVMQNILNRENLGLNLTRRLRDPIWRHVYSTSSITDKTILSSRDNCYFFPLYLYPDKLVGAIHELPLQDKSKPKRIPNFTPEFLQAFSSNIGIHVGAGLVPAQQEKATARVAPTPEEIFYYIYAVLYSPTYRKRYEEFLKIDFPRVPLPSNYDVFRELSDFGKELVDLHLLRHSDLEKTEVGFPKSGSNKVEKVGYAEESQRVLINKEQSFEGISNEVWEYRIGAYQVMDKYLKDRKGRKLSLDEINHYMKVAKAIQLTIGLQEKTDDIYRKTEN